MRGIPQRRVAPTPCAAIVPRELLPGTWLLDLARHEDARGEFVKTYAASQLRSLGLDFEWREQFVTRSRRGVLRGMHFQVPPCAHVKLVCCIGGAVHDVLLDLRRGPGYGRMASVELDGARPRLLVLPEGIAHGFLARSEDALMLYQTTHEYSPAHDKGIRWDGFGHPWPCRSPLLSERDRAHPTLAGFDSPFQAAPPREP